jgi:mxaJ protein
MSGTAHAREIRVCADPANLPFSNSKSEGYENRIVGLVAEDLRASVVYVWGSERRATALELLNKGKCDLVPATVVNAPGAATTSPYMRSSYAFVTRAEEGAITGFDDARLRELKIGVQSVGDDAVTPPVEALLHRGLQANILPYTLHGNASDPNSAAGIVHAVAAGDIDVAVLWGPFAGYFASRQEKPLQVRLASAERGEPRPLSRPMCGVLRHAACPYGSARHCR